MEVEITFIRSGMTLADSENRYIGVLDEPLSPKGAGDISALAAKGKYPRVERLYTSGLTRCRQTASLAYPQIPAIIVKELCPLDYGDFAGKTYDEISLDSRFEVWSRSQGLTPFPGGEDPYIISARNVRGFQNIVNEMEDNSIASAAIVTHKTAISSILLRFCIPRSVYNEIAVEYGGTITISYDCRLSAARWKNS